MFIIVEGIDRVGKTTLCNRLEQLGFVLLKDAFGSVHEYGTSLKSTPIFHGNDNRFPAYSVGKLDTAIQYIKALCDKGYNIVADRLHLTELVYGELDRSTGAFPDASKVELIDKMIAEYFGDDVMLVYMKPTNIGEANARAGRDLSVHDTLFARLFESSAIKRKFISDFDGIDMAVWQIVCTFKYDFYLASPFFTPDQVEREERIKKHLREQGYKVFSPREACHLKKDASVDDQTKVFSDNVAAIRSSLAVFAITDTKDMGTIWEAGFAYGIGKPIVYYAETLGNGQFNLMLAKSGKGVFTSQDQLDYAKIDEVVFGESKAYGGLIE